MEVLKDDFTENGIRKYAVKVDPAYPYRFTLELDPAVRFYELKGPVIKLAAITWNHDHAVMCKLRDPRVVREYADTLEALARKMRRIADHYLQEVSEHESDSK